MNKIIIISMLTFLFLFPMVFSSEYFVTQQVNEPVFELSDLSSEDVEVSMSESHVFFETSYFDVNLELIDFFVPSELQDDLRYVTPCDSVNGFVCQGDFVDPVYGESNLFHVKTDPNSGDERFYLLTDYLFDYRVEGSDISSAIDFFVYNGSNVVLYYVGDVVLFEGVYYECKKQVFNYNGSPSDLTQYWKIADQGNLVPQGFGNTRINQEVSMGYNSNNLGGEIFVDWNSSNINYSVFVEDFDLIINYKYLNEGVVVGDFNRVISVSQPKGIVYSKNNLEVTNVLLKEFGNGFVVPSGDAWLDSNSFKWGFNDLNETEDKRYKYVWDSNKEIRYDVGKDYYFFDEYYSFSNLFNLFRERVVLDVSDICSDVNSNCVFGLEHSLDENGLVVGSRLEVEFTGFFDANKGFVFIDPQYVFTDVSSDETIVEQVRSESSFSHLDINDANLVGYWSFDVDASDLTNNDNDGTFEGDAFVDSSSGQYGGALELDGTGDYVETTGYTGITGTNARTFSGWFKTTATNTIDNALISWGSDTNGGELFQVDVENGVIWYRGGVGNTAYDGSGYNDGNWHHVVVTSPSNATVSDLKFYVDGLELTSITTSGSATLNIATGGTLTIGDSTTTNDYDFNGSIDEVLIFNRALNSTEIQEIYDSQYSRFYSDGNQTFQFQEVDLDTNNRVNLTAEAEDLNGSSLNASLWEAEIGANTGYLANDASLVGYWHGDGDALDYSGNENDGTFEGNANANAEGVFNNSFELDGTGDYVDTGNSFYNELDSGYTLSAWIKKNGEGFILSNFNNYLGNRGLNFLVQSDDTLRITQFQNEPTYAYDGKVGGTALNNNNWYHVVATWNGTFESSGYKLYLNGERDDTSDFTSGDSTSVSDPGNNLLIGARGIVDNYLDGSIDEVMIFNRALSAEEIKSLYITGSTDHRNNGVGVNWTESSSGQQELTDVNATHKEADFVVNPDSNYLLTEFEFVGDSNYFYTPTLQGFVLESFFESDTVNVYSIDLNILDSSDDSHLTSVTLDFNVNTYDNTNDSPFSIDFNEGSYSVNVSKTGYDSNNNFIIEADSNKYYDIYLTQNEWEVTFNITDSNSGDHLTSVSGDCNVDSLDFVSENSPYSQYAGNGSYSCEFTREFYDSNTVTFIVNSSDMNVDIQLTTSIIETNDINFIYPTGIAKVNQLIFYLQTNNLFTITSAEYSLNENAFIDLNGLCEEFDSNTVYCNITNLQYNYQEINDVNVCFNDSVGATYCEDINFMYNPNFDLIMPKSDSSLFFIILFVVIIGLFLLGFVVVRNN